MATKCPSCKNDLYKPFTYCESCGWEADGQELEQARKLAEKENKKKEKELSKRRAEMTEKYISREKELGRRVPYEERNDDDFEDLGDEEFKNIFGEFEEDDDEDEYSTGPPKKKEAKKEEEEGVMIPCKCGNVIKVLSPKRPIRISCPKCGRGGTLKKDPPGAQKIKPESEKPEKKKPSREGIECPECGHVSDSKKFCPECGARFEGKPPRPEAPPKEEPREKKAPPEKKANVPNKGKCRMCGSTALQFKEDGRGRCKDCKHKFWWDKSKKPDNKEDRGGDRKEDRGRDRKKKAPKCPECRGEMEFIKKYGKFYCWDCNLYED